MYHPIFLPNGINGKIVKMNKRLRNLLRNYMIKKTTDKFKDLFNWENISHEEASRLLDLIHEETIVLFDKVNETNDNLVHLGVTRMVLMTCFIIIYKLHCAYDFISILTFENGIGFSYEILQKNYSKSYICKTELEILKLVNWSPQRIILNKMSRKNV